MRAVAGVLALLALITIAVALLGFTASIAYSLLVGLLVGAVARVALPGEESIGFLGTALIGMGGAMTASIIAAPLGVGLPGQLLLAVTLAALLLAGFGYRSLR